MHCGIHSQVSVLHRHGGHSDANPAAPIAVSAAAEVLQGSPTAVAEAKTLVSDICQHKGMVRKRAGMICLLLLTQEESC